MFDTTVVYFLVGLVILLGLALLWPARRAHLDKLGGQPVQLDLAQVIGPLVAAAEQTLPGATGAEKLGFVLRELERMTNWGDIKQADPNWVRVLIEAAVYDLKRRGKVA